MRASREAEHHAKTTRGQGDLPRAQHPKMWKQFGIVHHEFASQGQTVNAQFYCNVLRRLREDIRRKQPELWRAGNWLLHDDNAPSHRALATRDFLAHSSIITCPHPTYSPDLAPCDFILFPKIKLKLKGRRFDGLKEIQPESQNESGTLREQDFNTRYSSGNGAGIDVSLHKGTILKRMLPKLKSSKYILVYRSSLGTF
jgi:hypothetical protein